MTAFAEFLAIVLVLVVGLEVWSTLCIVANLDWDCEWVLMVEGVPLLPAYLLLKLPKEGLQCQSIEVVTRLRARSKLALVIRPRQRDSTCILCCILFHA